MPNLTLKYQPLDSLEVTSEYTDKRQYGDGEKTRSHLGLDLRARAPVNLYGAHDGEVIFSGWSDSYGNVVIIQDSVSGYSTLYAHLSEVYVDKGDQLLGQTLIGKTGQTGPEKTQPHLHFEIIDPGVSDLINQKNTLRGDDIKGKGRTINPRLLFADAFPDAFPTTVDSQDRVYDISGDNRDNFMIANSRANTLQGLSGKDTYYFPSLAGADVVDDVDKDGIIVIGDGKQSIKLTGNAEPKTDASNNVIPNTWMLAGFELKKSDSGTDLVITKAGAAANSGSITVKNFPFTNARGAFGITLGKTTELGRDVAGRVVSTIGYDQSSKKYSDTITNNVAYVTDSSKGEFVVVSYYPLIEQFPGYQTRTDQYALATLNNQGEVVSNQFFHENYFAKRYDYHSLFTDSGKQFALIPFDIAGRTSDADGQSYYQTKVGACLIDISSGKVTNSKIFQEESFLESGNSNSQVSGAFITSSAGKYYFRYSSYKQGPSNPNGQTTNVVKVFDRSSLDILDVPLGTLGSKGQYSNSPFTIYLPEGTNIAVASNHKDLTINSPKLRDLKASEIIANQNLAAGVQSTNPAIKQQILSFQEGVDTELRITPNPNSVLAIIGSGASSAIKLPTQDPSQVQIHSTNAGEYSLRDLLAGKFKPTTPSNRRLSSEDDVTTPRWNNMFEKPALRQLTSNFSAFNISNSTDDYVYDDDYSYDGDAYLAEPLTAVDQPHSVLILPNNQTVILVGVNATEVTKSPTNYFLTQSQVTTSPSGSPTGKPSTSLPSSQPTGEPSFYPTIGETIMPTSDPTTNPTGKPTLKPFADPTSIPSFRPSEIPSFKPSGNPTNDPTANPTNDPTANPTNDPTANPTNNPTNQPTSNPTNTPSSPPSLRPWQRPSSLPSQNPTLVSKDDSYLPTSKPSFNSGQPTSTPTAEDKSLAPTNNLRTGEPTVTATNTASPTFDVTAIDTHLVTQNITNINNISNITNGSLPIYTNSPSQFPSLPPLPPLPPTFPPTTFSSNSSLAHQNHDKPSSIVEPLAYGLGTLALVGIAAASIFKFCTRKGAKVHTKEDFSNVANEESDGEENANNDSYNERIDRSNSNDGAVR